MGDKSETQILQIAQNLRRDAGSQTPVLVVVKGEEIGRRYLLNERHLIMGRDPDRADLVLSDPSISGKHAMLQVDPAAGRFGIMDLGSRNGTFINGLPVESGALRDGDKIFLGATVLKFTFLDAIEKQYHSQMDRLIHIDSLTGLYVRRWFDQEYPRAFERARSQRAPFCVMMMDMDGLKQVNDRHGHQMGSYCIAEAGKLIRACIEPNGVGSRFGGDEFVVYVHEVGIEQALDLGEDVRRRIEVFDFQREGVTVAPTISIGVAVLEPAVASAEELTRLADDALYRAKKAGRNTVSR